MRVCVGTLTQTYPDWHLTMGATAFFFYAATKVVMEELFAHVFTHSFFLHHLLLHVSDKNFYQHIW